MAETKISIEETKEILKISNVIEKVFDNIIPLLQKYSNSAENLKEISKDIVDQTKAINELKAQLSNVSNNISKLADKFENYIGIEKEYHEYLKEDRAKREKEKVKKTQEPNSTIATKTVTGKK